MRYVNRYIDIDIDGILVCLAYTSTTYDWHKPAEVNTLPDRLFCDEFLISVIGKW